MGKESCFKITHIKADKKAKNYFVIIPGGPGLSSLTLRSLDILKKEANLLYIDFPGTNNVPYNKDTTFNELVQGFRERIKDDLPSDAHLYLIGHSFGGFFASALALSIPLKGLFCLSTPFSMKSLETAANNYSSKKTPALIAAEQTWIEEQSDESFKRWLAEYGEMYFLNPKGKEILLLDKVSARFFLANRSEATQMEDLLNRVTELNALKVFIAGANDGLLSLEDQKNDAFNRTF